MKKLCLFLWVFVLLAFPLTGCKNNTPKMEYQSLESSLDAAETIIEEKQKDRAPVDPTVDPGETETRYLSGFSAEGGEITRYFGENGNTARYQLIHYGEMGKSEENYYFVGDEIRCTIRTDFYTGPITDSGGEISKREYHQGNWKDGVYQTELGEIKEPPYQSLEELNDIFENAQSVTPDYEFSKYHILTMRMYLLGGYYEDQWLDWQTVYPLIGESEYYKLYQNGTRIGIQEGKKKPETEEEIYSGPTVEFMGLPDDRLPGEIIIGYSGTNDLQIESGTEISVENEIYRGEFQRFLSSMSDTVTDDKNVKLTRIVKIDIDNDGQDEVFIQAYYFDEMEVDSAGIQYMRKVVNGKVLEFIIPITDPLVKADYLTIEGFCDLNGDGWKEILVSSMGIGYHSLMVYEFQDGEFVRVLENGGDH